jgi:multidrug efflux pump subunit AcrA (membrane-fusion protein)
MQRRHYITAAGIVLLLALGFFGMKGLSSLEPDPKVKPPQKIKRYAEAQAVKYKTITSQTKATGRVASQNFVDLSSEVQGKILRGQLPLKKGQSFRKGQLLVRIFSEEAQYALKARKSRFLNSIANLLPDFKIDYPESHQKWLKFFEETDINKSIPPLPEIKSGREKVYLTSKNILSDYYAIKSEEVRLSKYALYAPFTGTFSEVYAEVGSIANPGAKIARMIRTDKLELEASVEPYDAKFINKGDRVSITSEGGKEEYKGTVLRISDFVDPQTQSVSVFISIHNNHRARIYQGEYMRAVFSDIKVDSAMLIDRSAVMNHNEVFTVKEGRLKKEPINIIKTNEETMIFNGLPEGTMVVTEALVNAKENTEIHIREKN